MHGNEQVSTVGNSSPVIAETLRSAIKSGEMRKLVRLSTSQCFIDCGLLLEVFITGTSGLSWGKSDKVPEASSQALRKRSRKMQVIKLVCEQPKHWYSPLVIEEYWELGQGKRGSISTTSATVHSCHHSRLIMVHCESTATTPLTDSQLPFLQINIQSKIRHNPTAAAGPLAVAYFNHFSLHSHTIDFPLIFQVPPSI